MESILVCAHHAAMPVPQFKVEVRMQQVETKCMAWFEGVQH